jgi:hypothetical protein
MLIVPADEQFWARSDYLSVCCSVEIFVDEEEFVRSGIHLARASYARRWLAAVLAVVTTAAILIVGGIAGTSVASAAQSTVGLGAATPFAVLAGTTVTNTGPSIISGDLGVSPGSSITGFPPGIVINGTQHSADAVAMQAQSDLTIAYNDAAGRTPSTLVTTDLGGQTLTPGVYRSASGLSLTGTVTLDGLGDPNAVFIFQAGSTLITASNSTVALTNGTQPCNVFWQVGSSATLGTFTTFAGNILALTSATVTTGASVNGRVLARNGAVTLDTNRIIRPSCNTPPPTTTPPPPKPCDHGCCDHGCDHGCCDHSCDHGCDHSCGDHSGGDHSCDHGCGDHSGGDHSGCAHGGGEVIPRGHP